ncbi:amyloid fiber anchoring/assembly protein TapA [Virgibacillus salexigens]|uniref:amyloid fiber anchoring/assembly protein TapA n=2 Tax=Virgibacillus TaxID=84406 RepID=UPI0009DB8174|nr:amyloid fiber anchoring/assembly protein TapA [Virgibacillus salexigens]
MAKKKGGKGVMRRSRLNKYKKKFFGWYLILKIVLLCYFIIFLGSYMTSSTTAHFNDREKMSGIIELDNWEKTPEPQNNVLLTFINSHTQKNKSCDSTMLKTKIRNDGQGDMLKSATYNVFYAEQGTPRKHGERVNLEKDKGSVTALKRTEVTELTVTVSRPGIYQFSVIQADGQTTWSEKIIVQCQEKSDQHGESQERKKEIDKDKSSTENPIEEKGNEKEQDSKSNPSTEQQPTSPEKQAETSNDKKIQNQGKQPSEAADLKEKEANKEED